MRKIQMVTYRLLVYYRSSYFFFKLLQMRRKKVCCDFANINMIQLQRCRVQVLGIMQVPIAVVKDNSETCRTLVADNSRLQRSCY